MRTLTGSLAPFQSRIYFSFWLATILSQFGSHTQAMAAAWLMAGITSSPLMVALVQVASSVPMMAFALLAGTLADAVDKRRLMLFGQCVAFVSSALLATWAMTATVSPFGLLGFTFIIGVGSAFYVPAWQSSVRDLVPLEQLTAAVGLNSVAFNLARFLAPVLGGVLLASSGAKSVFVFNALSYLGLLYVLLRWDNPKPISQVKGAGLLLAMREGLLFAWQSENLRTILVRCLLVSIITSVFWALMPVIARDLLGGGAGIYTALLIAFACGAIAGGLTTSKLRGAFGVQRTSLAVQMLLGVSLLLLYFTQWLPVVLLVTVIAGHAWITCFIVFNASVQLFSPRWVVGRAISVYLMTAYGGLALGSVLWGSVARMTGIENTLLLSGVMTLLLCIQSHRSPLKDAPREMVDS